ncbi:replication initiation protein [Vibrio phage vB_VpaS_SD15]|nr:replication initiation protein [Vibrio phage vB_VpaS_SD15]
MSKKLPLNTKNFESDAFIKVSPKLLCLTDNGNAALILSLIKWHVDMHRHGRRNKVEDMNVYEGRVWCKIPMAEFLEWLPNMSDRTVRSWTAKLEQQGLIRKAALSGRFDGRPDDYMWYCICPEMWDAKLEEFFNNNDRHVVSKSNDTHVDEGAEKSSGQSSNRAEKSSVGTEKSSGAAEKLADNSRYNIDHSIDNESSNEDSTPSKRTRRTRKQRTKDFGISKGNLPQRRSRTPKKEPELTKHTFVLEKLGGEKYVLTKSGFGKLLDFIERQDIKLSEEELNAWIELNKSSLGLRITSKTQVVKTIQNWLARFNESDRWRLDKQLGKGNAPASGRNRPQRLNGNISDKHTESEIRVPKHLQRLVNKES